MSVIRPVSKRISGNGQLLETRGGPSRAVTYDVVLSGSRDISRAFGPSLYDKPDWSQVLGEIRLLDAEHGDLSRDRGYILLLPHARIECEISVRLSDKLLTYKVTGSITRAP